MDENLSIFNDMVEYLSKAFSGTKPIWGAIFGIIGYVLFPVPFYRMSFIAVLAAAGCDVLTKMYSLCKQYDGYKNAVKLKKIFSKTLWKGTEVKIVSYLMISILTGLSYRVVYLEQLGIFIASFVYSVMFMREFQSNIENLIEAGADLDWLLLFSKKKNKELMKPYEEEETPKKEVNDYEQRI
ncbi:hypothetical protein CIW83_09615 [Tissierella sp. P1]|uniref:hypothetical protein n=1 Tax=Tissierella sp. P1 TaxID=1280483 RepID=UPI000BA0A2C9|nr:hypothetical protein [Tissierella sp. P1]OZV12344.1 hypothetical protein CIW83_09615 [Tissierella sp. P1]